LPEGNNGGPDGAQSHDRHTFHSLDYKLIQTQYLFT